MQQPQTAEAAAQRWSGASAAPQRATDRFPNRVFLPWVLLGLVGLGLLAALFVYLELRAAKQIVYLSGDGTLNVVRADGAGDRPLELPGVDGSPGAPQWSPRGGQFAAVVRGSTGAALLVADSSAEPPRQIPLAEAVAPALAPAAWAPSGNYVAVLDSGYGLPTLQIIDLAQSRAVTVAATMWPPSSRGSSSLATALARSTASSGRRLPGR